MRAALLLVVAIGMVAAAGARDFDLVIANGRVLDPESNLDAVRNIGIDGRKIVAISREPLTVARSSTRQPSSSHQASSTFMPTDKLRRATDIRRSTA